MLQKLVASIFCILILSACDLKQQERVEDQKQNVESEINIGDDIFEAKEKLLEAGFQIKYGPEFPTKTKKYLMMIVDYGERPNGLETFKYSVGLDGSDKPITGIIKATPKGKITSIE